jgi:Glucosamine 6-phosphate synthetase, contains amidotransferase and phosphosugar isomerase domains
MSPDDRDWLTDDFPELRDAPPWVMEEMIFAQPHLAAPILGADRAEVTRLREAVTGAAAAGNYVVVTGCGTSEHAAAVVAELLTDSFRRAGLSARAEARQALDAALDPRAGGVCIAISHDWGTRATQLALEAARESGATTGLITACADPSCASAADLVFVTPIHDDSWCHTLAYVSAILAGARISGIAGDEATDAAVSAIESTLGRWAGLEAAAAHLGRSGRIITAGLGIDQVSASELALKIAEGARIPTTAYHLETLLHGHLAGCDAAATSLVLLALGQRPGARRDRRLALVAEAARTIGIPTVALAPRSLLATLPSDIHGVALEPSSTEPLLTAVLQSAVAVQLLTLGIVGLAGTNPDLIRREERAYREAALIGDATPDW